MTIRPGASDPEPSPQLLANRHDGPTLDSARPSDVADVMRAQDALDRANAMSDPNTFPRLTDADFVVVTSQGLVRTKADRVIEHRIARLEERPERPVPRRDEVQVRMFGRTAIVTARNWPRTFERAPRAPARYTRVWINTPAGWRQLANISTSALQRHSKHGVDVWHQASRRLSRESLRSPGIRANRRRLQQLADHEFVDRVRNTSCGGERRCWRCRLVARRSDSS